MYLIETFRLFTVLLWRIASRFSRGVLWAIATTVFGAGFVHAQWREWDYEFDQEKKSWKEIQTQIPAYPQNQNLFKVDGGGGSPHSYLIDANSLSVGEDGVVRYTLVVRTGGGATNVSFEGIRCESREQKTYAFGRQGGEWSRARDPKWRRIETRQMNGYHYIFFNDYFCPSKRFPAALKEITQYVKYGPPRQPHVD